eukprot:5858975-Pleurochrysis_carterae.AAC.2
MKKCGIHSIGHALKARTIGGSSIAELSGSSRSLSSAMQPTQQSLLSPIAAHARNKHLDPLNAQPFLGANAQCVSPFLMQHRARQQNRHSQQGDSITVEH